MQLIADTEYEITIKQLQKARVATPASMTRDEIQALIAVLEEEMEKREWDHQWDETAASEEAQAYALARRAEVLASHNRGETIPYVKGKSLAELFSSNI